MFIKSPLLLRLVSALILVSPLTQLPGRAQELRGRVISPAPVEADRQSPIQVTSVIFQGQTVKPGRSFLADDDWIIGLTFRVKNVSDRPVSYVAISLRVPAAAGRENKFSETVGPYSYGCPSISPCRPDVMGSHKEIMPGETQVVTVAEGTYKSFTAALAQQGASTPIVAAEYYIDWVLFDADTMWKRGLLFKRDPLEPKTYRMGGRYELPKQPE